VEKDVLKVGFYPELVEGFSPFFVNMMLAEVFLV